MVLKYSIQFYFVLCLLYQHVSCESSLITLWRYFIPATVAFLFTSVELAKLAVVFCGQVKSSGVHNSFSC